MRICCWRNASQSTPDRSGSVVEVVVTGGSVVVGGTVAVTTVVVVDSGAAVGSPDCPTQKVSKALAINAPTILGKVRILNSLLLDRWIMATPYTGGRALTQYYHLVTKTTYINPQLVCRAGPLRRTSPSALEEVSGLHGSECAR